MKYHICNSMNQYNNRENTHSPDIIYDIYFRCMGVTNGSAEETKVLSDILAQAWIITRGNDDTKRM
jgi:hypothetical protein